MSVRSWKATSFNIAVAWLMAASSWAAPPAADGPKTPEELAKRYMAAFNKKDLAGLKKLRYPVAVKSEMQEMIDTFSEAELSAGTQYSKFEIKPVEPGGDKPSMGPDGNFYKPNLKPTNMIKVMAVTKDGSSSTTFPIGKKNGIYYIVGVEPAPGAQPPYQFGWQRFNAPASNWSVMLPNEPEPGRAALEKESGKDALKDPDAYGVVKNTADIKTFQHFFRSGEEGKRVNAPDNKETYRATCTTYTPETLAKWFSDPKKNLDDAVDYLVRSSDGKLVSVKEIESAGSPGREFEINEKEGAVVLGRVYWIKDALYELTFTSKKQTPDRAGAARFLESLEVK